MGMHRFDGQASEFFSDKQEVNVLAIVKDYERYIFLYDDTDATVSTILQKFGEYASDQELSFSWYDAAILSQKVRDLRKKARETLEYEDDFGEGLEF